MSKSPLDKSVGARLIADLAAATTEEVRAAQIDRIHRIVRRKHLTARDGVLPVRTSVARAVQPLDCGFTAQRPVDHPWIGERLLDQAATKVVEDSAGMVENHVEHDSDTARVRTVNQFGELTFRRRRGAVRSESGSSS